MISFEEFKDNGQTPIYLQICDYVKRGMIAGNINDGDELPSRRYLSARLGINPNTVQKAFKQLEDEGLITSIVGAKSYVTLTKEKLEEIKNSYLKENIDSVINWLKLMGESKEDAIELINRYWDGN